MSRTNPIVISDDEEESDHYVDLLSEDEAPTRGKRTPSLLIPKTCTKKSTGQSLTTYQRKVMKHIIYYPAILLIFKMGAGKTAAALCSAENLLSMGICNKVIVVGPKSVLNHWKTEAKAWGCTKAAAKMRTVTYTEFATKVTTLQLRGSLLIYDEAHNLANMARSDSRKFLQNMYEPDRILLLSGTPVVNRPSDMAILFRLLNPVIYGEFEQSFDDRFGENGLGGSLESGEKRLTVNHDVLKNISACQILYYAPEDDNPDFATLRFKNISVPFTKAQDKKYSEEFGAEKIENTRAKGWNAFLGKARRAMNFFDNKPTPKIKAACNKIREEVRNGKKVLVYSEWIESGVDLIAENLSRSRIEFSEITGSTALSERTRLINDYNNGNTSILLISSALSEGVDLKETDSVHILEQAWNTEKLAQVIGRARRKFAHARPGSVVTVYHYLTTGTKLDVSRYADQWLSDAAQKKHLVNSEFIKEVVKWTNRTENCFTDLL